MLLKASEKHLHYDAKVYSGKWGNISMSTSTKSGCFRYTMLQASYLFVKLYRICTHESEMMHCVPNNLHVVYTLFFVLPLFQCHDNHTYRKEQNQRKSKRQFPFPCTLFNGFLSARSEKMKRENYEKAGRVKVQRISCSKCLWGQICKRFLKGGCIIKKDSDVKTLLEPMPFPKLELTSHLFHLGKREDFQHHLR